jgi:hypothetical protein
MGRAQRQAQSHAASNGFEAVLGARRGSAEAQAGRDSGEQEERELAFAAFPAQIGAVDGVQSRLALKLIAAYRQQTPAAETASWLLEHLQAADSKARDAIGELAYILNHGDPTACSGLTTPALLALCDHFGAASGKFTERAHANLVILTLFGERQREESHYLRLQPLCERLGALLACPEAEKELRAAPALPIHAAQALFYAPASALGGPLASWVEAFAQRIDRHEFTANVRLLLEDTIAEHAPGSAGALALAPLISSLRHRTRVT